MGSRNSIASQLPGHQRKWLASCTILRQRSVSACPVRDKLSKINGLLASLEDTEGWAFTIGDAATEILTKRHDAQQAMNGVQARRRNLAATARGGTMTTKLFQS